MSEMGSGGEMGTPTKNTKTPPPQDHPPKQDHLPNTATITYPEWAAAFQAYYGSGTASLPHHGYFASNVASPHPYMWGAQTLMPPYGAPPPYASMYPGMYTHPSMLPGTHPYNSYGLGVGNGTEAVMAVTDGERKSGEVKDKSQLKRCKGSLGSLRTLIGKESKAEKGTSAEVNGVVSQSGDSGSEGSSEGSEGTSQNDAQEVEKVNYEWATSNAAPSQNTSFLPYGSACDGNNQAIAAAPFSLTGKQATAIAGTIPNLNIGMDYRGGAAAGTMTSARGKWTSSAVTTTAMIASTPILGPGRNDVPPELWLQDERELKRQRRKQSNRESARRSRLRKQAECEELAVKVESLTADNSSLHAELSRLSEQCKNMLKENSLLLEQLQSHGVQVILCKKSESQTLKCANLENADDLKDTGG